MNYFRTDKMWYAWWNGGSIEFDIKKEIIIIIYSRWIRLLFGREFPMQDLLVLWDAIFSDGIGFDLVDYIFVAMLLYLRDHCEYKFQRH